MALQPRRVTKPDINEISIDAEQINLNTDQIETINTAIQAACEGIRVDATAIGVINAAIQAAVEAINDVQTDKTQMAQITDGTTEAEVLASTHDALKIALTDGTNIAAVLATLLSLKTDLSSVGGTAVDFNSGDKGNGSQRVVIATNDLNTTAIKTATELIDDAIATIGSAFSGKVIVLGAKAESGVPTAVTDGQGVALWANLFGQLILHGANLSEGSQNVTDVSPAAMATIKEVEWDALDAAAEETPAIDIQDVSHHTYAVFPSGFGAGEEAGFIIWGSLDDGVTWFIVDSWTLDGDIAADILPGYREISGFKMQKTKVELDTLTGAAAFTIMYMGGNG